MTGTIEREYLQSQIDYEMKLYTELTEKQKYDVAFIHQEIIMKLVEILNHVFDENNGYDICRNEIVTLEEFKRRIGKIE